MTVTPADAQQELHKAALVNEEYQARMKLYCTNAGLGQFEAAELERTALHDLLDKYLDHYGTAQRILAEFKKGRV